MENSNSSISFFEKYLSIWVIFCIGVGVLIGKTLPLIPNVLSKFEYARVSIPVAILIWLMIYPMMLKIDFTSIKESIKKPKALGLTIVVNWLIKPFTMFLFSWFFFKIIFSSVIEINIAKEYIAGAVLLGAAPCTAMVFVWSHLTKGEPLYTLIQVAVNDIIILFAFTPIVALLLGVTDVIVPYNTLLLSVVLFVVIPLLFGYITRTMVIKKQGQEYFDKIFIPKFNGITIGALLLTLVIIFSFQGQVIISKPLHIILIAIPLTIQTLFIFTLAYLSARMLKLPHNLASPAAMIGASNFFELAVAVAISLFGLNSGATLVTVVGVLIEVPLMLFLVKLSNSTRKYFSYRDKNLA